ncbi:hypothetical protein BGX38DRAFT_1268253 [Terfezia claveryi]|nr:hypothetical protein BGX38DRAFT_1268253 [Terfezia claveryi]
MALRSVVKTCLITLRKSLFDALPRPKQRLLTVEHILSTVQIESLTTYCRGILSQEHITKIPGFTINPSHFEKYGVQIYTTIHNTIQVHVEPHNQQPTSSNRIPRVHSNSQAQSSTHNAPISGPAGTNLNTLETNLTESFEDRLPRFRAYYERFRVPELKAFLKRVPLALDGRVPTRLDGRKAQLITA